MHARMRDPLFFEFLSDRVPRTNSLLFFCITWKKLTEFHRFNDDHHTFVSFQNRPRGEEMKE